MFISKPCICCKKYPKMSFPGRGEAPNILHGGKMLASHFEAEIAGLQKWPFWTVFFYFFGAVVIFYLYGQTMYILQKKNCPQKSFPGRGEFFRKFICFVTATRPLNYYDYKSTCGAKNMVCGIYRVQLFVYWRRVITPSCCWRTHILK